jgi:Berberine and berberine like
LRRCIPPYGTDGDGVPQPRHAVHAGRANWKELAPLTKGFYTNYVDSDITMAGYRDNCGPNFERLVTLKAKYDPNNLFRLNANVPPKLS